MYELASAQMVNFNKTTVSFSKGVSYSNRGELVELLEVRDVNVHDKYLRLPTVIGRSKKVLTEGVKEKLWNKL